MNTGEACFGGRILIMIHDFFVAPCDGAHFYFFQSNPQRTVLEVHDSTHGGFIDSSAPAHDLFFEIPRSSE